MFLFISTSPFMKFHSRRFHISPKNFLRKIISKNSLSSTDNASLSSINIPSNNQSSNVDYLGIENDEGTININPQKHSHLQQNRIPLKVREKFYRAAFGVIRYDKDNRLKHHGQYGRESDFAFPHNTSNNAQVYNDFKKRSNDHVFDNRSLKNSEEFEKKDNVNYIDDYYFEHSGIDNLKTKQVSEELNFIDEICFETLCNQKSTLKNSHSTIIVNNEQSTSKELNFMENDYFKTLGSSVDPSVEQVSTSKYVTDVEHNEKHPTSEELNYIEKSYCETLSNSEHPFLKGETSANHFLEEDQSTLSTDDNIDTAVNKLSYFEDCTFSKNYASINEQSSENLFVNEESSAYNSTDISKINETDHHETEIKSNDISHIESNFFSHTTESEIENNKKLFKNILHDQINEKTYENKIKDDAMSDSEYAANFIQNKKKQACQDSFENLKPSTGILKSNKFSQVYAESCVNVNTNISNELHIKAENSFSKKNNFTYSKRLPEEHDTNDQTATAHDFVEKLRKEQNQNINKDTGETIGNLKVDSKGFRIFKNQTRDLSHCTRDEILHILKQNIVYSDENLLVLNKPYSLVTHESQTTKSPCLSMFLNDLAKEMDRATSSNLFTVHRLDKETTGCILLARNETMAMNLKSLFAQRKIIKTYWIVTCGVPDPREGVIDIPISEGSIDNRKRMVLHPKLPKDVIYRSHSKNGKPAVTSYKLLSESGSAALLEVTPVTGIKHQIRVHFGFGLGCPILGDHKYSHLDKLVPQKLPSDMLQKLSVRQSKVRHIPMHIHAKKIAIPNYFEGRDLLVNIPLPDHIKDNLKRLKFRKKDMVR